MENAWFTALTDVSDIDGQAAFAWVAKENTFGIPEPHHILARVEEFNERKRQSTRSEPWISTAPKFSGEKDYCSPSVAWKGWLKAERKKLYRSFDAKTGEIFLIVNPEAWDWKITHEYGKPLNYTCTFIRTKPQATGEFVKPLKMPAKRSYNAAEG